MVSDQRLTLLKGSEFVESLGKQSFCEQWDALHERCPWATVFQSRAFVKTWLRVYEHRFAPHVFVGTREGQLRFLWLLVNRCNSRDLYNLGGEHAEYHAWLGDPATSTSYLRAALARCKIEGFRGRIPFLFFAPDLPLRLLATKDSGAWWISYPHRRGLVQLAGREVTAPLRKRSNRSRLSRLRRLGKTELRTVTSVDEFHAVLDELMAQCDFRQSAIHNTRPFQQDPARQQFYTYALQDGLIHVAVLLVDGHVAASHVGFVTRTTMHLGMITYSPLVGRHSPGKLLLYMLYEELRNDGFDTFDLTPGGEYKARFATVSDTVYSLDLFLLRRDYLLAWVVHAFKHLLKSAARALGLNPTRVRALYDRTWPSLTGAGLVSFVRRLALLAKRWFWRSEKIIVYRRVGCVSEVPTTQFIKNSLADLLRTPLRTPEGVDVRSFLWQAMTRLESGQDCYTRIRNDRLVYCGWLARGSNHGAHVSTVGSNTPPTTTAVLEDALISGAGARKLLKEAVATRVRDALAWDPSCLVVARVQTKDLFSRRTYEECGFEYHRSESRLFLCGKPILNSGFTAASATRP